MVEAHVDAVPGSRIESMLREAERRERSGLILASEVKEAIREFALDPPAAVWPREPVRALYVDDDPDDQDLLRRTVAGSSLGWHLRYAESYDQACRMVAELDGALDLLIVDHDLDNGRTGLDVVGFAHRRCSGRVPSIMLSAHGFRELRVDRRMRWISTLLTKDAGFRPDVLDGVVCTALAHGEDVRRRLALLDRIFEIASERAPGGEA